MTKPIRAALAAGALLALAGCAVMQIDVDVYKGPLANHEDVQVQQFAAMAIGARPLLEQLEADLRHAGKDNQAKRVCDVLGLYENAEIPELLRPYLRETTRFLRDYEAEMDILEPAKKDAVKRWGIIEAGLLLDSLDPEKPLTVEEENRFKNHFKLPADSNAQPIIKKWKRFAQEYKELLYRDSVASPGLRGTKGMPLAYRVLRRALEDTAAPAGSELRTKLNTGDFPDEIIESDGKFELKTRYGSNSDYERLSDRDVVEIHAGLLFENSASEAAERFVNAVVTTAQAFPKARKLIENQWILSLETLGEAQFWDKRDSLAISRPIETTQRLALSQHLASFIASLTSSLYLDIALSKPNAPKDYELLNEAFHEYEKAHGVWKFTVSPQSIEGLLIEQPTEVARQLILVDDTFAEDSAVNVNKYTKDLSRNFRRGIQLSIKRKYGIVKGPVFKGRKLSAMIQEQTRAAVVNISGAFGGGRLVKGIETLITDFVELAADPGTDRKQLRESRNRLLDSLVRFSEKVLQIANNEVLLQDAKVRQDAGRSNRPVSDCTYQNPLSENQVAGIQGRAWPTVEDKLDNKLDNKLDRYVLVLQAVGNSITIQANELRFREDHDRKLKGRLTAEIEAVKRVLGRPPETLIGDVLAGVEADLESARAKLVIEETAETNTADDLLAATSAHGSAEGERDDAIAQQVSAESALDKGHDDVAPVWAAVKVMKSDLGDQLRTAAGTADTPTLDKMFAKIAEKIAELVAQETEMAFDGVADQIDTKELDLAKVYFEAQRKPAAADLAAIKRRIGEDVKLAKKKISGLESTLLKAETNLRSKESALRDATKILDSAITAAAKAQAAAAKTRARIPKLTHAVAMIKAHRVSAVEQLRKSNVDLKPSEVYARLIDWLKDKRDDTVNAAQAPKLVDAIAILEERGPPSDPLLLDSVWLAEDGAGWDPKHPNTRDALDTLIAALRHEHTEAVKETGPNGGRAPRLAAALKVAYEQRAGMAYIRPSAAYLRSSYPSTSLQDDPGLAWRNMLAGHALRSVPFLGQTFTNPPSKEEQRKIVREIDKQFWQSINRVRVAGAGDTNYVIAKDDIGNWYVKAFSADPEKIIKAAQKLALFNVGAGLDTNLLSRLDAKDGQTPEDVSKPALLRLFEEFEKDYAEKTGEDFEALKASIEGAGFETRIKAAWSGIKDVETYFKRGDIEADLASTFDTLQKTGFTETEAAAQSAEILAAADAILRFHRNLTQAIVDRRLTNAPSVALKLKEATLETKNRELKEQENKLKQKQAERDKANDTREELVLAKPYNEDAYKQAKAIFEEKEQAVQKQEGEVNTAKGTVRVAAAAVAKAQEDLQKVEHAERTALAALRREVREELTKLTARRNQTVKTFATGVRFIGKATKPAAKSESKPTPPAAAPDVGGGG